MSVVVYWCLLTAYVFAQGLGWWLTYGVFKGVLGSEEVTPKTLRKGSHYVTSSDYSAEELSNFVNVISLIATGLTIVHETMFVYSYTADASNMQMVWFIFYPLSYFTVIIVMIALNFGFLLFLSLMRVRLVFAQSAMAMSKRRFRVYLWSIVMHGLMQLVTLVLPPNFLRYSLWLMYDFSLIILTAAICYEFISRLLTMIHTMNDKHLAQRASGDGRFNSRQLRLFRVATKMSVLSCMICISVICWAIGPITLIISGESLSEQSFFALLTYDNLSYLNLNTCALLYCHLSFNWANRLYRLICGSTLHPCLGFVIMVGSDPLTFSPAVRQSLVDGRTEDDFSEEENSEFETGTVGSIQISGRRSPKETLTVMSSPIGREVSE